MPIHPEAREIMWLMAEWSEEHGIPPRSEQPLALQRELSRRTAVLKQPEPAPSMSAVEDVVIPTRGGPRPARVYRPEQGDGPVLIYVHGGGYVLGGIEETDLESRRFASRTGCTVVSISYRFAPEHPWPAAIDDVEDAVKAIAAGEIAGLTKQSVILAGVSAGAGLVAAATRRMMADWDCPVGRLVLLSPWLDMTLTSPSSHIFGSGHQLERTSLEGFCRDYIPAGMSADHPELSPARHPVHEDFPPTILFAAECDPLADDAVLFARRLTEAGVKRALLVVPGMLHGFHGWWQRLPSLAPHLDWLDQGIRAPIE